MPTPFLIRAKMSAETDRLLKSEMLPNHLWDKILAGELGTGTLVITPSVASAYVAIIDRSNLRELSNRDKTSDGSTGGQSQDETDKHFAQSFDGSAARAQLALLNPLGKTTRASNALVRSLSGNKIVVVDAPCGAGAASLTILATLAELRLHNVLPREPLDIRLIGGDISAPALAYAAAMLKEIRPTLEQQAINVEADWERWDVTNDLSTTDFIQSITLATGKDGKILLLVANFTGFLIKENKLSAAQPQLTELFRHCSGKGRHALWIEPTMNIALKPKGLFAKLRTLFGLVWKRFAREEVDIEENSNVTPTCNAIFRLPLKPTMSVRLGLALMNIDLTRRK